MKAGSDLLYTIFEQHLLNAIVEEETNDHLIDRVVGDYVRILKARGNVPHAMMQEIEDDLRDEVLEMLRKKTYGHYNLTAYRKAMKVEASQKKARSQKKGRNVRRAS